MTCPCGNGPSLDDCCGRYISGSEPAPTAEALMRSRYTAYATGAIDYVLETHHPDGRDEVDRDGAESWSKEADWQGLEILDTDAGGEGDDTGMVEFVAHYLAEGTKIAHREKSTFSRLDGRWYYVDGEIIKPQPVVRDQPKVGRNEPCPCGSGKKFKKCHGA